MATLTAARPARTALRPVAGGIVALAAAMGIGRFAFTPILPAMERAGALSTAQAGLLATANYAGYLAGALLVATAVPRAMQPRVLRASAVAVAVTTALMAVADGMLPWAVVRFASGVASAGVFVLASGAVLDELRRQGLAGRSGWLFAGPGTGIVTSGGVVLAGGGALGWRGDWAALALIAAAAVLPAYRWLPEPDAAEPPADTAPGGATMAPVSRAPLLLLVTGYTLEGVGYIVTGTFLSAIVAERLDSAGLGSVVWIVVGLAAMPAGVVWAAAGRRLGAARALTLAFLLQAVGIVLPLAGGTPTAVIAAVLFGGTFIGISALTLPFAGRLTTTPSATLFARLTAAYGLGQMVGPSLAGFITDRTDGYGIALSGAAAIVLAGALANAALVRCDPTRGGQHRLRSTRETHRNDRRA